MKQKTLLIIGGTGFFGKSILDYFSQNVSLKKKIKKIIILSRYANKEKIDKALKKNFIISKVKKNILYARKIPYADYVIYCAILKNYNNDLKAVKNYFYLAQKYHRSSKILYISSGAVYGQQPDHLKKINENYFFKNNRINFKNKKKNLYSVIKLKNEKIFQKLGNLGIKVSIARCYAFVGKFLPSKSHYAIGNFIQNILDQKPIKLIANYKVFRSYMHVNDLAEWLLKIAFNASKVCPIYNVGSDDGINLKTLGIRLAKKNNLDFFFTKKILKFTDRYLPSINKAKRILKLKLRYSSFHAVNSTINNLKK